MDVFDENNQKSECKSSEEAAKVIEHEKMRTACLYCLNMLESPAGDESVGSRISMVGGLYAITLLREALGKS